MCIACELGYWSMIDALEAERNAAREKTASAAEQFTCEPVAEPDARNHPQQSVNEPRRD